LSSLNIKREVSVVHQTKFVIYRIKSGQYKWKLIGGNGEQVASSENYASKAGAIKAAARIREIAASARTEDMVMDTTLTV